jgi:hypothetical protein
MQSRDLREQLPGARVGGLGKALEPLERVDEGVDQPAGIRSRLEPQLAPSDLRRRLVFAQPPIVPAPKKRLLVGDAQRPRRANMD